MPNSVVTTIVRCPMSIGRICAVLSALILLPSADAAPPEPALRRSEQLDVRRIGKVSEDERSVLRIEWRVGSTGVDEAHSVQDMLDNLRRIEQSMTTISLLVRNMPAHQPTVPPVAAEPAALIDDGTRLMMANIAAACLVALWWFRRRKSAKVSAPTSAGTLAKSPSIVRPPIVASPTVVPSIAPDSVNEQSTATAGTVDLLEAAPQLEHLVQTETIEAASAPMASTPLEVGPDDSSTPSTTSTSNVPSDPAPAAEPVVIDFSLEHDPEGEARANARIPVPRSKDSENRTPERRQELDVEPTLQLAEIMLSMGLEQGAAQALLEYIDANPRAALHHWMKLLGIYRKRGLHREFMTAAENLRKNFNIQAQYLQKSHSGEMPTLEKFSRVAEHVQEIWPRQNECIDYLRRLLEDNRDGERAGFPQSVAEEILLLIEIQKINSGDDQAAGSLRSTT